jgi:hypothetical protein
LKPEKIIISVSEQNTAQHFLVDCSATPNRLSSLIFKIDIFVYLLQDKFLLGVISLS